MLAKLCASYVCEMCSFSGKKNAKHLLNIFDKDIFLVQIFLVVSLLGWKSELIHKTNDWVIEEKSYLDS